jgi:hypothetical protein
MNPSARQKQSHKLFFSEYQDAWIAAKIQGDFVNPLLTGNSPVDAINCFKPSGSAQISNGRQSVDSQQLINI